jgi:Family of unknown function (DUF6492)
VAAASGLVSCVGATLTPLVCQDPGVAEAALVGLLPLKITGRHYGHNIGRCDILFRTLELQKGFDLIDELVIVVPDDELAVIRDVARRWERYPIRLVPELPEVPQFAAFTKPHQVRPWQRQQILKLQLASSLGRPFVLVLDPDVIALRPLSRDQLLPGGRALLEPESQSAHEQWWKASAELLQVPGKVDGPGISVTPAIVASDVCTMVQRRLEEVHRRSWVEVLLTAGTEWTEYTLYFLTLSHLMAVGDYHVWPSEEPGAARLHSSNTIWARKDLEGRDRANLVAQDDNGLFTVVQHVDLTPQEIVAAIPWLDLEIPPYPQLGSRRTRLIEFYGAGRRRATRYLRRLRPSRGG